MASPRQFSHSLTALVVLSLVLSTLLPAGVARAAPAAVHAPHVTEVFARDGAADVVFVPARHPEDADDTWSVTVTSAPGGRTAVVTDPDVTTARVTGLTNGTRYTFTATETLNGVASPASAKSAPATPRLAKQPHAPTVDSVLGRNGSLVVHWNPAPDHGAPVTGYTVTAMPANKRVSVAGTVYTATLTGLTNGQAQRVTVAAANKAGTGKPSKEATGTPRAPYPPGKPRSVSATPPTSGAQGALAVAWQAPADDGGQAITSYTVKLTPGTKTATVPGGQTSTTVTGLDPAVLYTISVTATNGVANPAPAAGTAKAKPVFSANSRTVQLSAASVASITKVSRHRVVFGTATAQVKALAVGNIIAVAPRDPAPRKGLLRKITNRAISGETVTLTTVDAKIQEAVQNSSAHVAPPPGWTAGGKARSLLPGARVASEDIGGRLSLDFQYKPKSNGSNDTKAQTEANAGFSAALTGNVAITPEWGLNVDISWFTLNSASITAAATIKASLDGKFSAHFSGTAEPATPIVEYRFSCFTFWIGWFPVGVCPVFTLNARVSAEGSLEFTFTASYEQRLGGSLTYTNGSGWAPVNLTTDPVTTFDPQLKAEISLKAELPAKLELLLYGLAGPSLTVAPGIQFKASPTDAPWGSIALTIDVSVGFGVPLLDLNWETSVYNDEFTVWESSDTLTTVDVSPHAVEVNTGRTTQFTARPVGCANTAPVTWSLGPEARGTISATGLYTAPAAGSAQDKVIATQAAASGCHGSTGHGYVLTGPTVPSAPQNLQAQKNGENYQLTWSAPADTGGQAITYAVQVCKHAVEADVCHLAERTTATSYTVVPDAETPEVHRAVTVFAYNAAGTGIPTEPLELD